MKDKTKDKIDLALFCLWFFPWGMTYYAVQTSGGQDKAKLDERGMG